MAHKAKLGKPLRKGRRDYRQSVCMNEWAWRQLNELLELRERQSPEFNHSYSSTMVECIDFCWRFFIDQQQPSDKWIRELHRSCQSLPFAQGSSPATTAAGQ